MSVSQPAWHRRRVCPRARAAPGHASLFPVLRPCLMRMIPRVSTRSRVDARAAAPISKPQVPQGQLPDYFRPLFPTARWCSSRIGRGRSASALGADDATGFPRARGEGRPSRPRGHACRGTPVSSPTGRSAAAAWLSQQDGRPCGQRSAAGAARSYGFCGFAT